MKTFVRRGFALLTLSALLIAALAIPVSATHSWSNYHWARTANPVRVTLINNVSSTWTSYLAVASTDWSMSRVLNTAIVPGGSSRSTCPPDVGRVRICNYTYGVNGWLGLASISVDKNGHIRAATVKLNDTYFNTRTYNSAPWRQLVMCQEVGHTFGLAHQDENPYNRNLGTCMDYTKDPSTNQHPNQHDYDQLVKIYSHTDSYRTTMGDAPALTAAAIPNINTDDPANWGALVSSSPDGSKQTFSRSFPDGTKLVTAVFWAK